MRAFFAAFPGLEETPLIQALVRELEDTIGFERFKGVRWVGAGRFHVTLRFLGNVDAGQVVRLAEATRDALATRRPLVSTATELALWPSPRRARVLVLKLDSGGALEDLAKRLEAALIDAGFGAADKPFDAHLTLARFRRAPRIELPGVPGGLALEFPRIGLFESVTRRDGAEYREVFTVGA